MGLIKKERVSSGGVNTAPVLYFFSFGAGWYTWFARYFGAGDKTDGDPALGLRWDGFREGKEDQQYTNKQVNI